MFVLDGPTARANRIKLGYRFAVGWEWVLAPKELVCVNRHDSCVPNFYFVITTKPRGLIASSIAFPFR